MSVFNLYFDGGTTSGTSNGYGSFEVCFNGFSKHSSRIPFLSARVGLSVTCNVAEYLSLIAALGFLRSVKGKSRYKVVIHGDSQLVLRQLSGRYKARANHLKPLLSRAKELLDGFGEVEIKWQPRINNVRRFGH